MSHRWLLWLLLFSAWVTSSEAGEWIHDHRNGCGVWNPAPQPGESIEWDGDCVAGRASGRGVIKWIISNAETERAEGHFVEGQLEGQGTWRWASGHRYEGNFSAGAFNGYGVFTWPNGARYSGEFLDNEQHGAGKHKSPTGARYDGPFRKGERHGVGRCYQPGDGWSACRWHQGERVDGYIQA